jgi:hypothetical protein
MKASFGRKKDMLVNVGRCRLLSIRRFVAAVGWSDGSENCTHGRPGQLLPLLLMAERQTLDHPEVL